MVLKSKEYVVCGSFEHLSCNISWGAIVLYVMKTLVIHPFDITTGFLESIYLDKGFTVIDYNPSTKELKSAIKAHDRIIMLGHGDPHGLLGFGRYVIDSTLVYLLKKKYCICIWCNADQFVNKYDLRGFYTGMFISEESEATYEGVLATWGEIMESNEKFAETVGQNLHSGRILETVTEGYNLKTNVAKFNRDKLYINA